jgi:hypothetical protein
MIAVARDARLDVGRIRGGHRGLGHQEGGADLAVHQRPQPFPLLLLVGVADQDLHVAGVGRRAVEHFGGPGDVAHLLREQRIFEVGEAGAAEFVILVFGWRQEHVPESLGPGLRLQLLQDRDHFPATTFGILLLVDRDRRADMLLHEAPHPLLPLLLLG